IESLTLNPPKKRKYTRNQNNTVVVCESCNKTIPLRSSIKLFNTVLCFQCKRIFTGSSSRVSNVINYSENNSRKSSNAKSKFIPSPETSPKPAEGQKQSESLTINSNEKDQSLIPSPETKKSYLTPKESANPESRLPEKQNDESTLLTITPKINSYPINTIRRPRKDDTVSSMNTSTRIIHPTLPIPIPINPSILTAPLLNSVVLTPSFLTPINKPKKRGRKKKIEKEQNEEEIKRNKNIDLAMAMTMDLMRRHPTYQSYSYNYSNHNLSSNLNTNSNHLPSNSVNNTIIHPITNSNPTINTNPNSNTNIFLNSSNIRTNSNMNTNMNTNINTTMKSNINTNINTTMKSNMNTNINTNTISNNSNKNINNVYFNSINHYTN
ncbi:hypothetical protein U3516DRAFT_469649, partial [Neocallimastix sp. 'constans']